MPLVRHPYTRDYVGLKGVETISGKKSGPVSIVSQKAWA